MEEASGLHRYLNGILRSMGRPREHGRGSVVWSYMDGDTKPIELDIFFVHYTPGLRSLVHFDYLILVSTKLEYKHDHSVGQRVILICDLLS